MTTKPMIFQSLDEARDYAAKNIKGWVIKNAAGKVLNYFDTKDEAESKAENMWRKLGIDVHVVETSTGRVVSSFEV